MWNLYNKIINQVPFELPVVDYVYVGKTWTAVFAGTYCGVSITINEQNKPVDDFSYLYGLPLREVAGMCKSWDFIEASLGTAALNAYINSYDNIVALNCNPVSNTFDIYREATRDKKVAVIGHFPNLEKQLPYADIHILERKPQPGDFPDSACEYILPEMDYVFITGSAFVNKTLPRLLQLSRYAIILGPSTPMSPVLYSFGASDLSGYCPVNITRENVVDICNRDLNISDYGNRISLAISSYDTPNHS